MQLKRFFHTVRHLHARQILWRLKYLVFRQRPPKHINALPIHTKQGLWVSPPVKASSFGETDITLLHQSAELDALGAPWHVPELSALWNYHLHYFEGLMADNISIHHAREMIAKWIEDNPPVHGVGWDPYPVSRRISYWIMAAQRMTELLDERALQSLTTQAHMLCKRIEYHLAANHLLANAKALFMAGTFFSGEQAEKWLEKGTAIFTKELPKQFLSNGAHEEASPMYHALMVEDLLDCMNLARRYGQDVPKIFHDILPKALAYLKHVTHPNGQFALFNDAAHNVAPSTKEVIRYAAALGILPEHGIDIHSPARLEVGNWCVLFDNGAIGPDHQPGHAHADSLTFELSYANQLVVVDTGTSEYGITTRRHHERSTAAHNTLVVDGKNSSDVWAGFRVGKRARTCDVKTSDYEASAWHDGYAPLTHRRAIRVEEEAVHITDQLAGEGTHRIALYLHFAPEIELMPHQLVLPDGTVLAATGYDGLDCQIQAFDYAPEFGLLQRSKCLIFTQTVSLPWSGELVLKRCM